MTMPANQTSRRVARSVKETTAHAGESSFPPSLAAWRRSRPARHLWLDQIKANVDARTLASYKQLLRLHVRPVFGPTKMRLIHRGHVKAFLAQKIVEEFTTETGITKRRLGKNSLRLIRATLSVMFGDAVEMVC